MTFISWEQGNKFQIMKGTKLRNREYKKLAFILGEHANFISGEHGNRHSLEGLTSSDFI